MRILNRLRWFLRRVVVGSLARVLLRCQGVEFGAGLVLHSFLVCRRSRGARIQLGANVAINNKIDENPAGIAHRTVLAAVGEGAKLVIGSNVAISGAVVFCACNITIEDHVNIGAGVKIYDTDFHPIGVMARRMHDISQIRTAPVRICHDAWLGADSMILKGVTIGARSIVAARAVVVKDVPEDCIVAGVPAHIVARLDLRADEEYREQG